MTFIFRLLLPYESYVKGLQDGGPPPQPIKHRKPHIKDSDEVVMVKEEEMDQEEAEEMLNKMNNRKVKTVVLAQLLER